MCSTAVCADHDPGVGKMKGEKLLHFMRPSSVSTRGSALMRAVHTFLWSKWRNVQILNIMPNQCWLVTDPEQIISWLTIIDNWRSDPSNEHHKVHDALPHDPDDLSDIGEKLLKYDFMPVLCDGWQMALNDYPIILWAQITEASDICQYW